MGGDGGQLRGRAFAALTQYLRGLQQGQGCPVVLTLEDLQWADPGSLDFLGQLPSACADLPVMMLCASRLKPQECSGPSPPDGHIELSALSEASSHDLVDAVLGRAGTFPAKLRDLVIGKAQGNPYFIQEIVSMMIDEGVIVADGPHWKVLDHRLTDFRVPTTLTGLLQARLDLLPPSERSLLQKASVIGYVFWDEPLRRVAAAVTETLDALGRRELVMQRDASSVANAREHAFRHHVLHQVTYVSVLKRDKRELHRLAAEWLLQHGPGREGEFQALIAGHFEQAGDGENAAIHFRRAAIDASKKFAHEAAVGFVERALGLAPAHDLVARYELIKTRASCLDFLARRDEELADIHVIERLAEELDDDAKRAEAAAFRARYAVFTGDDSNAAEWAERAAMLGRSCGDASIELMAMSIWASALIHQHQDEGAEGIATQMLQRAGATGEYRRHIDALHLLGNLATGRGRYSIARAHFEQALHIARAHGNLLFEAIQLHNVADVEQQLGNYAIARDRLQLGLRICSRVGAQKIQVHLLSELARVEISSGAPEVAIELISQCMAVAPALRNAGIEANLLSIRGDAQADLGQLSEAFVSYRESQALYQQAGMTLEAAEPMAGLARVLLVQGEFEGALSHAEEIERRLAGEADDRQATHILLACSEVHAAAGQPGRAEALLNRARNLLQRQAERLDLSDRDRFLSGVVSNAAIMRAAKVGLHRREGGGISPLLLVGLGLAFLVVLAAIFGHRRSQVADSAARAVKPPDVGLSAAPPRVPNAARPTSNLPGAIAQAEAQARQWGPGGGPPVVIPDDTTSIQLRRPIGSRDSGRSGASAAPATGADADMVAFAVPAAGTMTPCGNDTAQTSLRYRNHIEVEYRRNFMSWECRYLPTGSRAESKVAVDCDKNTLATWSYVFFRGGAQINETMLNEKMHAPRPDSLDATLLSLACALPRPAAIALGRQRG
jgi:predicted ATPase